MTLMNQILGLAARLRQLAAPSDAPFYAVQLAQGHSGLAYRLQGTALTSDPVTAASQQPTCIANPLGQGAIQ